MCGATLTRLAQLCLEEGSVEQARPQLEEALHRLRDANLPTIEVEALLLGCTLERLTTGDLIAAGSFLQRAQELMSK